MVLDIEKELKIYLIIGFIVLVFYGLWLFISPESWIAVNNWPLFGPVFGRYLGATYIGWAIILLKIILKQLDEWEKVENWIIFGTVVNILNSIAAIISIIVYTLPPIAIVNLIINLFFAIVGIHILIQKRE